MAVLADSLAELRDSRDLLRTWTLREIKIRYKQSLLGGLWAILQPLSIAVSFSIIFSRFIRIPTEGVPHIVFYYTALFPWTFFATAVTTGSNSLVGNLTLVTKIHFPREILPLAGVIAALFDFCIAFVVYVGIAALYSVPIGSSLVLLPVLILIQSGFTIGVVLTLAALNVFYRDIRFVVPLALQLYMYSTPLIYPLSSVPESIVPLYLLNPMAALIHSYRLVLAHGLWPDPRYLASAFLVSVAMLAASYVYFTKASRSFADLI